MATAAGPPEPELGPPSFGYSSMVLLPAGFLGDRAFFGQGFFFLLLSPLRGPGNPSSISSSSPPGSLSLISTRTLAPSDAVKKALQSFQVGELLSLIVLVRCTSVSLPPASLYQSVAKGSESPEPKPSRSCRGLPERCGWGQLGVSGSAGVWPGCARWARVESRSESGPPAQRRR